MRNIYGMVGIEDFLREYDGMTVHPLANSPVQMDSQIISDLGLESYLIHGQVDENGEVANRSFALYIVNGVIYLVDFAHPITSNGSSTVVQFPVKHVAIH